MDGTQIYLGWYIEWQTGKYSRGYGVVHPAGEPIINPWAQKATEANINKPDDPNYWKTLVKGGYTYFGRHVYHDSFFAYAEFMQEYLGNQGTSCLGPSGGVYDAGLIVGVGIIFMFFMLLFLIWFRNPQFYWFRPDHGKRSFVTCGWWRGCRGDPYDMSRVYEEFAVRAMIGQEMADKECKGRNSQT